MESLQERKAKLEKEMREIEALEKAQSIRDQEANKNELVERLLTDLRDAPLGCALPLSSVSHVKSVFRQPACKGELCAFFDTCSQIIQLTGKQSAVKRSKANGGETKRLSTVKVSITREGSLLLISFNGETYRVTATNWKGYKENLKTSLPRKTALAEGLTAGQYSALMHEGSMKKFFK